VTLHRHGYEIAKLVLTDGACERIIEALPEVEAKRGGVRDLLSYPAVARLVRDERFAQTVASIAEPRLVPVKATLFDKTPRANWRVQWHQDRVLTIDGKRTELETEVLERMVAVRVHLDECGSDDGPLRVIAGSHRKGKLSDDALLQLVTTSAQTELTLPRGAILFMRPLLVHASSAAIAASHRRVLHIELMPAERDHEAR
jgi:ectoine hydroxylase-related dioxygenase (phytanoyl-CoA dioxygenase family)